MQTALPLLLLLSSALSLALPTTIAKNIACPSGSFSACLADTVCAQSFPASCYCHNNNIERCSAACGASAKSVFLPCPAMAVPDPADQPISLQPVPALESRAEEPAVAEKLPVTAEKLPVFTPKLPIIRPGFPVNSACVTKCSQGQACIQSWPASCYCEDGIQRRCKAQCGVDPGPAKVCGGDLAAM